MNELKDLLNAIGKELDTATSKEQAIEESKENYLSIDYNIAYGGYRIDKVNVKSGACGSTALGESCVKNRVSKKEMKQFLIGYLNGIKKKN